LAKNGVLNQRNRLEQESYSFFKKLTFSGIAFPQLVSQVVDTDNLVDPANESGDFYVDARHVKTSTAKTPRHEANKFIETVVLTNKWSTPVTLFREKEGHELVLL